MLTTEIVSKPPPTASGVPCVDLPFNDSTTKTPLMPQPRTWYHRFFLICRKHASFVGPGIIASVAYFDPGNWATDLAAGANYGYALLCIVLCAGLEAILFQVLSCRLGIVTGKNLAQHLRSHLHNRPNHPLLWRWGLLYPLYALSETAIIATDLAESLGSAIAINLLIPSIPLYAGVLLTAADVLLVLVAFNPSGGARSMRPFELIIACLVVAVFISFLILLVRVHPIWAHAFKGYLPSKTLLQPGALYSAVSVVGATVMPHALYLGSHLSTIDRLLPTPSSSTGSSVEDLRTKTRDEEEGEIAATLPARIQIQLQTILKYDASEYDQAISGSLKRGTEWMTTHLRHATIDIVLSLFGFAVTINSAILIAAAAAFYYGAGRGKSEAGDLFDAFELIKGYFGKGSAFLFAFALLCAAQSASITATLAGQVVSEGFLQWRVSPYIRRLLTRAISIVPSIVISVAVGRHGIDSLLVGSQVLLSMVLPFVVLPLIYFTSSRSGLMRVTTTSGTRTTAEVDRVDEVVDFSSAWYVTLLGYLLVVVMIASNVYALVQLARGQT